MQLIILFGQKQAMLPVTVVLTGISVPVTRGRMRLVDQGHMTLVRLLPVHQQGRSGRGVTVNTTVHGLIHQQTRPRQRMQMIGT